MRKRNTQSLTFTVDVKRLAVDLRGYDPVFQVAALRVLREEESPVDAVVAVEATERAQDRDS